MPQVENKSADQIIASIPDGLTLITPNLISTSQHSFVTESSDELFNSVKEIIHENKPIENDNKVVIDSPFVMIEKEVLEEDLEVTIKLFYLNSTHIPDPNHIRQGLKTTLAKLGVSRADLLLVAFHGFYLQDDSQDASTNPEKVQPPSSEQILAVWKAMETLQKENLVGELGVSEFSKQMLIDLLDKAEILPSSNQINLADCCVIPRSLREFAKTKNVKLFTHNDPSDLVPKSKFQEALASSSSPISDTEKSYQPQWATRYSVLLKNRGIVSGRGYIVHAS